MTTITFVTGNAGKFREASAIIPTLERKDLDLPELQELDPHVIIQAKLDAARQQHAGGLVVEDTSLYVDGLNGLPGPLIKWFLDRLGVEGIAEMVERMGRGAEAEARCIVGFLAEGGVEPVFFEEGMKGSIVTPRGDGGFGWDRLFQPEGTDRTLGELTVDEKNAISSRARAFSKFRNTLE